MKISRSKAQALLDKFSKEYKDSRAHYMKCRYLHKQFLKAQKKYPEELNESHGWSLTEIYMAEDKARMSELRPKIIKLQRALGKRV